MTGFAGVDVSYDARFTCVHATSDLAMCTVFDFVHSLCHHFHGSILFLFGIRHFACSISPAADLDRRARTAYTGSAIDSRCFPLFHRRLEIHLPFSRSINFFGQEQDGDSRFYGSAGLGRQGDGRHVYVAR